MSIRASQDKPMMHKALQELLGAALPLANPRSVSRDESGRLARCAAQWERSEVMPVRASNDKPMIHQALQDLFEVALPIADRR